MRKAVVAVLACAFQLPFAVPAQAAFPSEEDRVPAPGLNCIERAQIPDLVNVIDAKWSPDGATLAYVRFERRPSSGPSGYLEDEILELLDMRTGKVRSLGTIEYGRPAWSPSGRYLAYWGYKADFLEVMDRARGEVIAKLTPTMPDFRWAGDTLLYIEKSTIRAWKGAPTPATISRLGESKVPHYSEFGWGWSGDGSRFTITKYDPKEDVPERFIGTTQSGDAEPLDLPGATLTDWAPSGAILLVRYAGRLEVRDLIAGTTATIPIARNAVHFWGSDGRTLFVQIPRTSVVAGDVYEEAKIVWPAGASGKAIVPDLFGTRSFSPDGRYFSGTVRTDRQDDQLVVFRCYEIVRGDPAAAPVPVEPRWAKIDGAAARLIRPAAGPIAQFFHIAHTGVDVAAPFGSPIVAADDGVVTKVLWHEQGGGLYVCLQHAGGLETCYYHISAFLVGVGQRVARGQAIALIGMSGVVTGPHLHYEAKLNGKLIDPLLR